MNSTEQIISQTRKWITDVVVACNFCPFAAKELRQNTVRYVVVIEDDEETALNKFLEECKLLDANSEIETTLIIFPQSFQQFNYYLDLVEAAENLIPENDYEGIYQVASFHPQYCFASSPEDDAANYTNRSPYPMLHILREERIEKALLRYENPELIPERNIVFAREKGAVYMQMLRDSCL